MEGDRMNNTIKRTLLILISAIFIVSIPLYSNAFSFDDVIGAGNDFLNQGSSSTAAAPTEERLRPISNAVSNILLTIAFGVTLISAAIMAINFTIQSVEDKAKIKESMVPWIIGIFVSFGAYGIWRIVMSVFYSL